MVETVTAISVTVLALGATTLVGLWAVRGRTRSAESLISAQGQASEGMTVASVIASIMGVWILLSPAEAGAAFGGLPAILGYAVGSAVPLVLFVVIGTRIREVMPLGHSLTQYVHIRFGSWFYGFVLAVAVFYLFLFLAAEMTGISLALQLVADVPLWMTASIIGGFVLVYTAYGGLVASLVTDTVQALLLLPLLVVGFASAVVALGGAGSVHSQIVATRPALLDPTNSGGMAFGLYVVLAVVGANLMNQGLWQRVWAADSEATVRRSFGIAAVAVVPMVLIAGLFGVAAAGLGVVGDRPGIAFFLVLDAAFPAWVTLAVIVIASLLVASSADTVLNAIASIVTTDVVRFQTEASDRSVMLVARVVTVLAAASAMFVGAQGYGVLTLFLLADLLAAAAVAPFVLGLYLPTLTERGALAAGGSGLAVGLAYVPSVRGILAAVGVLGLPQPSFLVAFVGATAVSVGVSLAAAALSTERFPMESLREVNAFDRRTGVPQTDGGSKPGGEQR
jgi:Na+/proline symporter